VAFGTSSSHFVDASLQQLIAAARLPLSGISEIAVNASLAFIEGAKPRDEVYLPFAAPQCHGRIGGRADSMRSVGLLDRC
jgi:hypothetical protein